MIPMHMAQDDIIDVIGLQTSACETVDYVWRATDGTSGFNMFADGICVCVERIAKDKVE